MQLNYFLHAIANILWKGEIGVEISVFLAPLQSLWNVSIDCQCLSQDLTQHFFMVSCGQEGKDWTEMFSITK